MNKLLFIAGIVALASSASASTVTYSTSTSQICDTMMVCGSNVTVGNVNIAFNPLASSTVLANPTTFGSFGEIVISCVGGGTACGNETLPGGIVLNINITQSVPTMGSGPVPSGSLVGSLSGTASSTTITWPVANTVTIGGISYSVANNPLALVPPSVNNGTTSVQAIITDNQVPEPSTYAMLAAGLVGLGALRRKR